MKKQRDFNCNKYGWQITDSRLMCQPFWSEGGRFKKLVIRLF